MPKLVSIIIPAWNAEKYIKEAVDSALNQTYENIEVIVVNDGSTDQTEKVIEPYLKNPKFRYFKQANGGLAFARNTGLKNSKGEFIALLDSDDVFLPRKIERQIQALEGHPDFGVCYCDLLHFTDTEPREFFHHRYTYPSGDIFGELIHRQFINPLTVVIRKSVLDRFGGFDPHLRRSEDWELWLRLAKNGVKFYHLNEILAHYRVRSVGNLSSVQSEPEMKEKNLEIFLNLEKSLDPEQSSKYHFPELIRHLKRKLALAYLTVGKKSLALEKSEGFGWRLLVRLVPGGIWKLALGFIRKLKHRLLLKKVT